MKKQSIAIYFIYHPANKDFIEDKLTYCFNLLKRNPLRPFSRALNLPIFFRTSLDKTPPSIIKPTACKNVAFVFLSSDMIISKPWVEYIDKIHQDNDIQLVPIALDQYVFNINSKISQLNHIRAYDFPCDFFCQNLFIYIAHELYRLALNENFTEKDVGNKTAIEIFISHAKDGGQGINIAKELKRFIDGTHLNNFFDSCDIAPAYKFETEIREHIKKSTMVAIHSDQYSSRYWCQKEIALAKELQRPIIAVDCLEEYEDRRFPLATNIPAIHVSLERDTIRKKDLYRIVMKALLETVRFFYAKEQLALYRKLEWIEQNVIGLYRPPEFLDVLSFLKEKKDGDKPIEFIYPEPPVYEDEVKLMADLGINTYTPLTYQFRDIKDLKVGLSISDVSESELVKIGRKSEHLVLLSQDITKHLLSRGVKLFYGGDLRPEGFTHFLFEEAQALQSRLKSEKIFLFNYIAWPIYLNNKKELSLWKAKYNAIARFEEINYDNEVSDLIINKDQFLPCENVESRFVWAKCLTKMRQVMIETCDIRICAGGKLSGYKGKMPGVLEEILIALSLKKPIFLIGGFGGITKSICNLIQTRKVAEELSLDWQKNNNSGYSDLLDYINRREKNYHPDYDNLSRVITNENLNNGLTKDENEQLFSSEYMDEIIYLILKGMSNLRSLPTT